MSTVKEKGPMKSKIKHSKTLMVEDVEITKFEVRRMIENGFLKDEMNNTRISDIFEKIDVHKTGKIRRSELLAYISKHKDLARTTIKEDIKVCFQSESEKIFTKLQKLKSLCIKLKEPEAVKDIEWIIESLISTDINEPILNEINTEEMEVLKHYSKVEQKVQRNNDIKKVHMGKLGSSKNTGMGLKINENINTTPRNNEFRRNQR